MKAVRLHDYGGPEVLHYEETPKPTPGAGELLVKLKAASVNPVDWKIRDGYFGPDFKALLPITLGCDGAGIVEAVGEGVSDFQVGEEVYGYVSFRRDGTYAEYVVAPAAEFAPKPPSLTFEEAASLPVVTLTAWDGLIAGGELTGKTVLIHAAAGGVGSIAVQLAKALGAGRIIGTASARNHDFVRELGATEVIDYTTTRFEDVVQDADLVLETIGGENANRSVKVLKRGGHLTVIAYPGPDNAEAAGVTVHLIGIKPDGVRLKQVTEWVEAGQLKPLVEVVLPLSEVHKAHELSATNKVRGKIILKIGE